MKSESTEVDEILKPQSTSPTSRGNFSKYGRLFDQTFYLETAHTNPNNRKEVQTRNKSPPREETSPFTSVGRDKRGNFRFDIKASTGQFTNHPNFFYGTQKLPSWSFSKKQRYKDERVEQYEICPKHPIARKSTEKLFNSTSSIKETMKTNLKLNKSASVAETMDETKNYSIILPRKTSPIGFFTQTKIKNPLYLSKQEIMNEEEALEGNKQIQPCPKGYIQFAKKCPRGRNPVAKGLTVYEPSYSHEKHFNNFSMTSYPKHPEYHIDFEKHLNRKQLAFQSYGPNPDRPNINPVRKNFSNIDLNTKKFRNKIRTRYDRAGAEPNTRLDYGSFEVPLGGMVEMDRMLGRQERMKSRKQQLQPIVDPAIKKAGDAEMKQILKKHIKIKQINEALRPRCAEPIKI